MACNPPPPHPPHPPPPTTTTTPPHTPHPHTPHPTPADQAGVTEVNLDISPDELPASALEAPEPSAPFVGASPELVPFPVYRAPTPTPVPEQATAQALLG